MNPTNDFRIIDDAPETGADTNTGVAGGTQPGSGAPHAEDATEHESTSGTGEVMQALRFQMT